MSIAARQPPLFVRVRQVDFGGKRAIPAHPACIVIYFINNIDLESGPYPRCEFHPAQRLVSREEGEAIARIALQHWPQIHDKPDCSHLVHEIYAAAKLDYEYAPTNGIFAGDTAPFQRVYKPQPGDLIVWQGHVGIVIDPEDNSFYSSVMSGFSVSSYASSYWISRGPHRFYRYKINDIQSARLLDLASCRQPYLSGIPTKMHEATFTLDQNTVEDEGSKLNRTPRHSGKRPRVKTELPMW